MFCSFLYKEVIFILQKIKSLITDYLTSLDITIISLKIKSDYGISNIIELILEGEKFRQNHEEVHLKILDLINDIMPDNYYLEVSGRGAEYPLDTEAEILTHLNYYILVKSPKYRGFGYLVDYNPENKELKIKVKEKTREKIITLYYDKSVVISTAVKM